ncbi:deleted in malignant brain tumors 1 protein-like [Huso huso]|uniref:Deleted in malignant brain tumors 1 protein-like n=1 Tax=Huso huso TaxID=61971 RepID=A0ABR0YGR3_HUSHU
MCYVLIEIAQLVCRDLGCGYAASAPQASLFGEGTGPVWKPSVECVPGRSQMHCTIIPMQTTSCNHSEDAGVICSDILNIRLANGANNCSGRVEFYYKDQWEAGCGDYWDMRHAQVVCRELGCGYAVSAPVGARFGNRTAPYWRKGFHCSGEEQSLISCSVNDLTTCHKDASVICSELGFDIRLINGSNNCSGRVELYFEGQRRRMCNNGWDNATAHVVCKQLGCGYAISPQEGALFGEGTDPSWLLGVSCTGRESSLERCLSGQNGIQECTDGSAVSVICSGAAVPVRLVNGNNSCSGRVEFNSIGVWKAVCGSDWDMNDAEVVCRELGCGSAVSALRGSHFGQGQGSVWQYRMECTGRESSLERCDSHKLVGSFCSQKYSAGAVCSGNASQQHPTTTTPTGKWGYDLLDFISSSTFSTVRCVFIICYLLVMSTAVISERGNCMSAHIVIISLEPFPGMEPLL